MGMGVLSGKLARECFDIFRDAEGYLDGVVGVKGSVGGSVFESKRGLFLKQGYVGSLSSLIEASIIFLERAKGNWDDRIEEYGRYLLMRLDEVVDESWRFEGEYGRLVRKAYDTLKELRNAIRMVIESKGRVDMKLLERLQRETDKILLDLHSIERELALSV